jgi:hypothetical protein
MSGLNCSIGWISRTIGFPIDSGGQLSHGFKRCFDSGDLSRYPDKSETLMSIVRRKLRRRLFLLTVLLISVCGGTSAVAHAAETAKLTAGFTPDRRGASTTIVFGFTIGTTDGSIPSGLSGVDLHLPAHMDIATTSLGLASCETHALIELGLKGCSSNSRIGYGSAVVEVPLGPQLVEEQAGISALLGPSEGSQLVVLFYANGLTPVFAQLVFPAQLLPDSQPFGGRIDTRVPIVPVLPEGPNASVVSFRSTIGPRHLTYHRRVGGRTVRFHPRGLRVPKVCPSGGYPFAADFEFQDATSVTAETRVPCPSR